MATQQEVRSVLFADDLPSVRGYLRRILEGAGYGTIEAFDGEEAVFGAIRGLPDAIILDVEMGSVSGLEVCRRLKNHAKTRDIPVILVTAKAAAREEAERAKLGVAAFVQKPFKPRQLLRALRSLLPEDAERRNFKRKAVSWQVTWSRSFREKANSKTLDISESGLAFTPEDRMTSEEEIDIRMQLADDFILACRGHVAYAREDGRVGVEFTDIDPDARKVLRRYVHAAAAP